MKKLSLLLTLIVAVNYADAQPGFLKNVKNSANNIVAGKPAISTNFKDVNTQNILPADFGSDKTYVKLNTLRRNEQGCYDLGPGFYQTTNLSYCLKAGTVGPAKGDAYGLAPVAGKMEKVVEAICKIHRTFGRQKKNLIKAHYKPSPPML